jgi:hypothetical protein
MIDRTKIIAAFVACFEEDGYTVEVQKPLAVPQKTSESALDPIYNRISVKFPPMYEQLVLSYRWYGADIGLMQLLKNEPGPDLKGLEHEMFKDSALSEYSLAAGFVQFGRGATSYDPVCFDIRNRKQRNGFSIVQLDHEEILCNSRIRIVSIVASSFEELVEMTLKRHGKPERH